MIGAHLSRDPLDQALIDVVSSILLQPSIAGLCEDLTKRLSSFLHFDRIVVPIHDPSSGTFRIAGFYSKAGGKDWAGFVATADETPTGEVVGSQRRYVLSVHDGGADYPMVRELLRRESIGVMCYLPLTTPSRCLGAIAFGTEKSSYSPEDLRLMEQATKPVAIAIENILNREALEAERTRLRMQLDINNALVSRHDLGELFDQVSEVVRGAIPHDFIALSTWNQAEGKLLFRTHTHANFIEHAVDGVEVPMQLSASGEAFASNVPRIYSVSEIERVPGDYGRSLRQLGIRSMCALPLRTSRGPVGAISFGSHREGAYGDTLAESFRPLAEQLAIAVENALSFEKAEQLNRRLQETNVYLEEELLSATGSDEMLGQSAGIRRVLQQIETVAATDATVIVYGETGSGKELVARALHQRGPRNGSPFVKLNCAAIPAGLLESELFGHEKGAFTGAIAQKMGRFELAHKGTLFLDEIGEIPLELQPKLLRVLQEKEFERLGSSRTLRSDARLIAATNRDLKKLSTGGQFRPDLYYRLNVFPITVPPLRERKEDIPMLVMHFMRGFSRRFGKNVNAVPSGVMERLSRYHWPGNIRELQNLIERSVILTTGETLRVPMNDLEEAAPPSDVSRVEGTLEEIERDAIVRALKESKGVIGGPKGAALKLGMKRTSLLYRMEKLGIRNESDG